MSVGRLLRSVVVLTIAGGLVTGVAGFATSLAVIDKYGSDLPDHVQLADYVPATGSLVLADDGTFLSKRASQRRRFVPIADIPPLVKAAFVSAEDKNYATHSGVDPVAMLRAAVSFVGGGVQSGASTITQQVAKNLLVGSERSLERKVREALLAIRMDRDLGKDRILEIYLNEIYLGRGAYGVAEAARTYFGVDLDSLSTEQAALIAAMPKAPSAYNPVSNPTRARERRDYVIRRMADDGIIASAEAARALSAPMVVVDEIPVDQADVTTVSSAEWFEDEAWRSVQGFLADRGATAGDATVETTLSPALQNAAVAALRKGVEGADRSLGWRGPAGVVPAGTAAADVDPPQGLGRDEFCVVGSTDRRGTSCSMADGRELRLTAASTRWTGRSPTGLLDPGDVVPVSVEGEVPVVGQLPEVEGAMVVVDPRNGDVRALVGGYSHRTSVFDRVTQARRQPGSSFKPIVYMAALELGYDATSPLLDAPIVIEQGPGLEDWRPSDARTAGKGGLITVREALEQSRNLASVRLLWDIGLDVVSDMARRLGVLDQGRAMTYPAALGASEVTPMQLAMAYSTIANGGLAVRPRLVKRILDRDGGVVAEVPSGIGKPTVDPIASAQMMSILSGVPVRGTARRAFEGYEGYVAGKTGTTNSARDAWFAAASGNLVAIVWIGRDDNRPLASGASGGRLAAAVVRDFLDGVAGTVSMEPPAMPDGVETVLSDPRTGLPSKGGDAVVEILRPSAARSLEASFDDPATAAPEEP